MMMITSLLASYNSQSVDKSNEAPDIFFSCWDDLLCGELEAVTAGVPQLDRVGVDDALKVHPILGGPTGGVQLHTPDVLVQLAVRF